MQETDLASFSLQILWILPGKRSCECFGKGIKEEGEDKEKAEIN